MSIHVLLIEDEESFQRYAREALTQRGLRVSTASDTFQADKILAENHVDVIVCDVFMPWEDGITYVTRLRDNGENTPVIFLSALADVDVKRLGVQQGAAAYMTKPFQTEDLYQRILSLVDPRLVTHEITVVN
jgi:DNA-binding response OmpR family regulator